MNGESESGGQSTTLRTRFAQSKPSVVLQSLCIEWPGRHLVGDHRGLAVDLLQRPPQLHVLLARQDSHRRQQGQRDAHEDSKRGGQVRHDGPDCQLQSRGVALVVIRIKDEFDKADR